MSDSEKTKKLLIFIFIFYTILGLIVSFKGMALMTEYKELLQENEKLKGKIEYQKSVIMDLEEYLKYK